MCSFPLIIFTLFAGVDEETRPTIDIDKKLERMNEHDDDIDFDDDDDDEEGVPDLGLIISIIKNKSVFVFFSVI